MSDLDRAVRQAGAGDREALGDLYRAFAGPLLGYLVTQTRNRQDAEDLLGEVFLAAVKDLKRFSGDASGFRAWLYRIATNRSIDLARRRGRRPEQRLPDDLLTPDDLHEQAESAGRRAQIWRAVLALPDEQRRVIALRLTSDLSAPQIADLLGKTTGAVKALQHRAMANLAKALGGPYPDRDPERLDP